MSRLPLPALQGFLVAARAGNLSRAAESMHLTVSALSHQIKVLEERMNCRLFVRGSRGVSLTPDGERLLERVAPHLDALAQALQPFAARRDDVLTISVTPSMASAWLVPRLGGFLAAHPKIEINLQSDAALVDFARNHGVDAALRIGVGQWPGVTAEHLFDEWLVPMASPALIARMGTPSLQALADWPLIGDPDRQWNRWFALHGGTPPARYTANLDDSESMNRAALEGVGVALGRLTRARLLLDSGQLVALTRERLKTEYAHYLVYPPRSATHGGLLAFRTWLLSQAGEHARHMEQATVGEDADPQPS